MRIFVSGSHRNQYDSQNVFDRIYEVVEELGYENIDTSMFNVNADLFHERMNKLGKQAAIEHFSRINTCLKASDINIFECTVPSVGLGYQINKSLELSKPTILLYIHDINPFVFFTGLDDEKLIIKEYNDKTLKKTVRDGIEIARQKRDKRFSFFISPKLLEYLETASTNDGATKSKFIRSLIINHMWENRNKKPVISEASAQ